MSLASMAPYVNRAARGAAVALGFSIPISVAFDNLLLTMILVLFLASVDYREKLAVIGGNRVALAALTLFALLATGIVWGERDAGLAMLGKYLDLAFVPIFIILFRAENTRRHAWLAFAAALMVTLVLSYLMWSGILTAPGILRGDRNNPQVFKDYLAQNVLMAFGAFLFAHFALHAKSLRSRMSWSVLALLAVVNVIVMMQGRTGQLVLAVLALYFTYSAWRWRGALLAVAGIMVVVVVLALGPASASRMSRTLDEWRDWRPGQATATATGLRLEWYQQSLAIIRDHPLIGVGTGGFATAYASRVAATGLTPTTNPHNEYLNITIQLGVIGLAALLYLFYCEWRVAASLATTHELQLARGLVITFVIGCLFNSLLMDHTEGLLFAWASGLLFAGLKPPWKSGASAP
jgi:O-antigen ligase